MHDLGDLSVAMNPPFRVIDLASLRSASPQKRQNSIIVGIVSEVICSQLLCRGTDYMSSFGLVDSSNRGFPLRFNIFSVERDRLPRLKPRDAVLLEEAFVHRGDEVTLHGRIGRALRGNHPNPLKMLVYRKNVPLCNVGLEENVHYVHLLRDITTWYHDLLGQQGAVSPISPQRLFISDAKQSSSSSSSVPPPSLSVDLGKRKSWAAEEDTKENQVVRVCDVGSPKKQKRGD